MQFPVFIIILIKKISMSAIGCGMKKGGFYLTKKPLTSLYLRTYNPEYPNIMSKNAEFKNKN